MFDKMLKAMNLDPEDDYDEDYEEETKDSSSSFLSRMLGSGDDEAAEEAPKKAPAPKQPRLAPAAKSKTKGKVSMEVCVIKPAAFEDAREISETLLADRTVILNMEGLDTSVAQRIIDFMSGTCYAIDGNMQKISPYIFVITPAQVELSGDLLGLVDTFDFSGVSTGF